MGAIRGRTETVFWCKSAHHQLELYLLNIGGTYALVPQHINVIRTGDPEKPNEIKSIKFNVGTTDHKEFAFWNRTVSDALTDAMARMIEKMPLIQPRKDKQMILCEPDYLPELTLNNKNEPVYRFSAKIHGQSITIYDLPVFNTVTNPGDIDHLLMALRRRVMQVKKNPEAAITPLIFQSKLPPATSLNFTVKSIDEPVGIRDENGRLKAGFTLDDVPWGEKAKAGMKKYHDARRGNRHGIGIWAESDTDGRVKGFRCRWNSNDEQINSYFGVKKYGEDAIRQAFLYATGHEPTPEDTDSLLKGRKLMEVPNERRV